MQWLKFIPDWLVTSKMLETFHDAWLANDSIIFFHEDFSEIIFFANEMGIFGVDLHKINLDDDNKFYQTILKLLSMSDFWLLVINLKSSKHLKKI